MTKSETKELTARRVKGVPSVCAPLLWPKEVEGPLADQTRTEEIGGNTVTEGRCGLAVPDPATLHHRAAPRELLYGSTTE